MTMHRGRTLLAAAALAVGGIFAAATGSAQAAPLAPAAVETVAGEAGATAVHWRGHGHHFGRHHHHHRHFGYGRPRHHGWHHHHHRGHHHHGFGRRHHW
ncbi:hypothetical protein [Methylobacterium haplocladii]|uniref:hypothetical protein n=1 Tax=Methylobacterium haplocladii TaxID=1176176 RepID=UPI0011BD51AA|nr:hypothetical protein [Methylobacterium haplocladii]